VADYRYAQISRFLNFGGKTQEEQIESLIEAIKELMKKLNMPTTIADCGINEAEFLSKLPDLAERAFEDQCTTANPRYPLIDELIEIYKKAYYGE